jgi:hypothetical protein
MAVAEFSDMNNPTAEMGKPKLLAKPGRIGPANAIPPEASAIAMLTVRTGIM